MKLARYKTLYLVIHYLHIYSYLFKLCVSVLQHTKFFFTNVTKSRPDFKILLRGTAKEANSFENVKSSVPSLPNFLQINCLFMKPNYKH